MTRLEVQCTGFSSEIETKLRESAVGQAGAAATLRQHCPQMTQRRCTYPRYIRTHARNDKRARIAQQINSQLRIFKYRRRRWRQSFRRRQIVGFSMTDGGGNFLLEICLRLSLRVKAKSTLAVARLPTPPPKNKQIERLSRLRQKARQQILLRVKDRQVIPMRNLGIQTPLCNSCILQRNDYEEFSFRD